MTLGKFIEWEIFLTLFIFKNNEISNCQKMFSGFNFKIKCVYLALVDGAVRLLDVLNPEPVGRRGLEEGHVEPRVGQDQGCARCYSQVVVAVHLK